MNPNKSPGPNGAAPRLLKELHKIITEPLYLIFRQSLDLGKIPVDRKMGLSPIFKKGNRHQAKSYRPVSLTSVICNSLASIIRDHIIYHIVENQLLTKCQNSFIKGRSCVTQLLAVLDKWIEGLDLGNNMHAVYLDFAKVFDSVPHQWLLMKIKGYSISGKIWKWIEYYLFQRNQQIVMNGMKSLVAIVLSLIPQWNVLGPLLVICFINGMPEVVHSNIWMFVDDTKIFRTVNNWKQAQLLQDNLDALEEWSNLWQLRFNAEKCKLMHLGSRNKLTEYHMHKWSYVYLDNETVKTLYNSLARPHLEYGNTAWCPVFKKDCELLENAQCQATKLPQYWGTCLITYV